MLDTISYHLSIFNLFSMLSTLNTEVGGSKRIDTVGRMRSPPSRNSVMEETSLSQTINEQLLRRRSIVDTGTVAVYLLPTRWTVAAL